MSNTANTALVIGGGHNGLVAACYLAKAGRKVTLLEARPVLGGLAGLEDLAGVAAPVAAHLSYALSPRVLRELGLAVPLQAVASFALDGKGGALALDGAKEAAALRRQLLKFSATLAPFQEMPPPALIPKSWREKLRLARLGLRLRLLGRQQMNEFLRMGLMPVQDVLDDTLDNDLLKGALANEALMGSFLAPRSPGGVLAWLYRLAGEAGGAGPLSLPLGGMGAIVTALETKARALGVEIRTGAAVTAINSDGDKVTGVTLAEGQRLDAGLVLSSLDLKATLLRLCQPDVIDAGLRRRAKHHRAKGLVAKFDLLLSSAPRFAGVAAALPQRLVYAPSLAFLEESFDHAKYGELAAALPLEILLSDAGAGRVLVSVLVNAVPAEADAAQLQARLLLQLESLAPGLEASVVAKRLRRPADFARDFGVQGGHWHHGEITIDQFFMMRPVAGATQYRLPLEGLFLCGAAAHPGGNVTGLPGRNSALVALKGRG